MRSIGLILTLLTVGVVAQAGSFVCPDQTYLVVPISGVTGGVASSCGNATVDALGGLVATPGGGTVAVFELENYLGVNLTAQTPQGYALVEGSAVRFAGFNAPVNSQLSFSWESVFEEGGTAALFYLLNGSLTVLDIIYPDGQGLPGASNSGTLTVGLLDGTNTFAFGALSLTATNNVFPAMSLDPQLSITNLAVTQTGVPEPGTFGLMGVGLAGLVAWMRRRG